MGTMTFGFSAQSDEARHMTLGLEVIKFILEQDPANVPIVQRWIDKWTWRGYRVLTLVGMMMDYMPPKRTMSWKEAWEIYFEENGGALFADLARYGIRCPSGSTRSRRRRITIPPGLAHLLQLRRGANFHTWTSDEDEMDWLSEVSEQFRQYYRPRWSTGARGREGQPLLQQDAAHAVPDLPDPDDLHRAGRPDQDLLPRSRTTRATKYHFCSDGCKEIFEHEPEKYIQAWLPVHQIYQGNCFPEGTDPTAEGFDPLGSRCWTTTTWHRPRQPRLRGPEDKKNFAAWRGQATEEHLSGVAPRAPGFARTNRRQDMGVAANQRIRIRAADRQDKFHGAQLLYIGWEDHLMFCAPFAFPVPADHAFRRHRRRVLPGASATTRTSRRSTGRRPSGSSPGKPWAPDFDKSLADNGPSTRT